MKGDWHEFESKALRKENERKDKEARRAAQKEKEKKRSADGEATSDRDPKRIMMGPPSIPPPSSIPKNEEVTASNN